MSLLGEPAARECSRAGCRTTAAWRIDWRNPRIHTGDRGKTWLACDEHRGFLEGFLDTRGFPVTVSRFDPAREDSASPAE